MKKKYNVIWIDDEWDKMTAFKDECEIIHQIHLEPFRTQKAGMEELDKNLNKWDAVILDAKMFDKSETNEVPRLDGLRNAINHINQLSLRRKIPYFISTGQPDLMDNETFEQGFGHYFVKEKDDLKLIEEIKREIELSPRRQVLAFYQDAIEQINEIGQSASEVILDILESMHYPDSHPDFNPILYYNQLRQILEYNFRAAKKLCIVPNECFDDKGDPNLSQCCHYLSGNDATHAGVRYGSKEKKDRVVPLHIELMMRMVLDVGNTNSHSAKLNDNELKELEQYLNKNVFNSRYLIYSLALNVCEITLWFKNYINHHQDIEKNLEMCKPLNGNEIDKQTIDEDEKEAKRLLGAINKEKSRVYSSDLSKNIIIDKKSGFKKNCSPKEYDYVENEKVYFELKEQINPNTNSPFYFAINVSPARKEKPKDINNE